MTHPVWGHVRRSVLRGLALVLPLLITLWLLALLFQVIDDGVTPRIRMLLAWFGVEWTDRVIGRVGLPLLSLLLTVLVVYLLGLVSSNLVGRRLIGSIEASILRVPLVKGIYGSARQLLDAFRAGDERGFSRVVIVEYPRKGLWTLGFVTTQAMHRIPVRDGAPAATVPVFLPTTPNPTSGWMILVPSADLILLDISMEDAIKLIVSGGIVGPRDLGKLVVE